MSTESAPRVESPSVDAPQVLDLTGLPAPVVEGLRTIVASLRQQRPAPPAEPAEPVESPEEKARRFLGWIESQGVRVGGVRDDRESIYEGRGDETAEQWIARLNAFVASQPVRSLTIDDDRDTIYEGRGE